jgi:aminoglycoside phosphotransferase (APT) family kinase protein
LSFMGRRSLDPTAGPEAGKVSVVAEWEVLQGGVANAGAVVREGAYVLRPSNPQSGLIHALFRHIHAAGFDGVPEPVGIDPDGRERLVFIRGDVAWPPFPAWCQTDRALASIAELLARFHAAAQGFEAPAGATWNRELADPVGGSVICHNALCLENVVFRDGLAVALLDFDFAAPGRPLCDLGVMARMCVPLDTPEDAAVWGWGSPDPIRRLRLVADSYGLPPGREGLVRVIEQQLAAGGEFVRRRVERGEAAFVEMWERMGGEARYDRRRDWLSQHRARFVDVLG